jgi:hypothetical protein
MKNIFSKRKPKELVKKPSVLQLDTQGKLVLSISDEGIPVTGSLERLLELLLQDYLSTYSLVFIHTILDLVSVQRLLLTMTDCLGIMF